MSTSQDQPTMPSRAQGKLRTVTIEARGEAFKIVQVAGMLLVCARQHGRCCCGWDEKGRMPFDTTLWGDEWERRKIRNRLHLTFTGCLGPCAVGNSALLQIHGRSIWFKDLNEATLVSTVFDYIESMLSCGTTLPPPPELAAHVYERFSPQPGEDVPFTAVAPPTDDATTDDLDGLDPVCLMAVDQLTARHTVEHDGTTIAFCAPSCKRAFLADPAAYLTGSATR